MANKRLVRGNELARIRKAIKALDAIERRDAKAVEQLDPTSFKGMKVFGGPGLGTLPAALAQVRNRLNHLATARV